MYVLLEPFRHRLIALSLAFAFLSSAWLLTPLESRLSPASTVPSVEGKAITVWKVGSPYREDAPDAAVPSDLALSAEGLGYTLKMESFPARAFAQSFFEAFAKNQEPDILVIDNHGIIDGISTPLGTFTGIGADQKVLRNLVKVSESLKGLGGSRRGWEFLIRTSKNYEAAKSLALRSPDCDASWQTVPLSAALKPLAVQIASAYVARAGSLEAFNDPERLSLAQRGQEQRKVLDTRECGYWGNDHLAFAPMVISYESAKELGHATVLLALRRQEGDWGLLVASADPVTTTNFLNQVPRLARLLEKPWSPDTRPSSAELDQPSEGQFPAPPAGQRFGEFTWRPSPSVGIVAEVVEFASENDARLLVEFPSVNGTTSGKVSAGMLWTIHGPWKWRVWCISETGAVSFSQARSFLH
jgi:hypothetical protein